MDAFSLQYAHALADVVLADKLDTKEIDRQLEDFQSTWTDSRQLREVFQNPSIQLETKLKVLDAMVPRIGMLKQVRNFVALLLQNDRIHAVESITTDYRNEINRRLHIGEAEITFIAVNETRSRRRIAGDLHVKVPLIGGTAERKIVPGLVRRLDVEAEAVRAEIATR